MTNKANEFDRLMLEAFEAEVAGVFASTPVDAEGLVARPVLSGSTHWYRHVLVGLPLAACIAMFVGVATLWEAGTGTTERVLDGTTSVSTMGGATTPMGRCQTLDNFRTCFSGPGVMVGMDCRCVDFDSDGDVDLRDMGILQVQNALD